MNGAQLLAPADPFGLPAPAWVFVSLLNLTLVVHFLFMGYVFTASLVQVFLALSARPGSAAEWMLRRTEGPLPVALSFTITFGVAPLLFVQTLYQPVFYTGNILIGYQWFGIVFALMGGFYLIYALQGGRFAGRRIPRPLEALGRLLIFAAIFYVMVTHTTNALLALHPERWAALREAGRQTLALGLPVFWPRLLHNALAALVIGSLWLITLGLRAAAKDAAGAAAEGGAQLARLGGLLATLGLFVQFFIGLWLLIQELHDVPALAETLFSGRPGAILWMISLAAGLAMLVLVVLLLALPRTRWVLVTAWGVLAVLLGGMFAGREVVRQAHLAPYFTLGRWAVRPQLSSLTLFAVLLLLALALIALMGRWLAQGSRVATPGNQE